MRPLMAALVVGGILGGLQAYMMLRPQPAPPLVPTSEPLASGRFELEVTLTFAAGPDPFALQLSDAPSLLVMFRGREILRRTEVIEAGQVLRLSEVDGIAPGPNEFFLRVTPRDPHPLVARAVRLRVLRDGRPIAERTLWSEPGEAVEGALVVVVS